MHRAGLGPGLMNSFINSFNGCREDMFTKFAYKTKLVSRTQTQVYFHELKQWSKSQTSRPKPIGVNAQNPLHKVGLEVVINKVFD